MWPALSDRYGSFDTGGHGITIRCRVSDDPRIFYYSVQRTGQAFIAGAAEIFLAVSLNQTATSRGMAHMVLLGEFHSADQLLFAMGTTESTGEAAASEFRDVLPPGAVPMRLGSDSPAAVKHLGDLIRGLEHE
jgi:hypothetical protein